MDSQDTYHRLIMSHQSLTPEERRAVEKQITEAEGILALCHNPDNQNKVKGYIVALTYLIEHGRPLETERPY